LRIPFGDPLCGPPGEGLQGRTISRDPLKEPRRWNILRKKSCGGPTQRDSAG
jgi:hypothetical protein